MQPPNSGTRLITHGDPQYNSWTEEENWRPSFIDMGDDNWENLSDIATRNNLSYEELVGACESDELSALDIGLGEAEWMTTVNNVREYLEFRRPHGNS